MVATSALRVPAQTSASVQFRIDDQLRRSVAYHAAFPERIPERLAQLDREWDVERILEANAATVSLLSLGLAATHSRKWLLLSTLVPAFLLQHALQGWCPPLPVFRRLGFRTRHEIDTERCALQALRGDFRRVDPAHPNVPELISAVKH